MKKLFLITATLSVISIAAQEGGGGGGGGELPPGEPVDMEYDCEFCGTGVINISTGFNHAAGNEYPVYSRDEYWMVTRLAEPAPEGAESNYCAWVIPTAPIWQEDLDPYATFHRRNINGGPWEPPFQPDPDWRSQWISTHPSHYYFFNNETYNCMQATSGPIRFTRKFEVCGGYKPIVHFDMIFLSDGRVGDVYIDGVNEGPVFYIPCGGSYNQTMVSAGQFHKDLGLTNGVHTISFDLYNNNGNYLGVNVQGTVWTDGQNKITDVACFGQNDCESMRVPPCDESFDISITGSSNGRDGNNNCLYTLTAQVPPAIGSPSFEWYNEVNPVVTMPMGQSSNFNAMAPNGKKKSVTVRVVGLVDGRLCALHKSIVLDCAPLGPPPPDGRIMGLSSGTQQIPLTLYPNPSEGMFTFSRLIDKVIVLDLLGREVYTNSNIERMELMHLPDGTYMVKVSEAGAEQRFRIVVSK